MLEYYKQKLIRITKNAERKRIVLIILLFEFFNFRIKTSRTLPSKEEIEISSNESK